MTRQQTESTINAAASRLRARVREAKVGAFLGSEEALMNAIGVSRTTIRQVARLLEREGLLQVRRGINGGYFASQPDLKTIETTVSAYLEMLDTDVEDTIAIGAVLWIEAVRKAAQLKSPEAKGLTAKLRKKANALKPVATFQEVLKIDREIRASVFELINGRYMDLIFQINSAFARRQLLSSPSDLDGTPVHEEFVIAWRNAKLLEFDAIATGDPELGVMAARRSQGLWYRRLWGSVISGKAGAPPGF